MFQCGISHLLIVSNQAQVAQLLVGSQLLEKCCSMMSTAIKPPYLLLPQLTFLVHYIVWGKVLCWAEKVTKVVRPKLTAVK